MVYGIAPDEKYKNEVICAQDILQILDVLIPIASSVQVESNSIQDLSALRKVIRRFLAGYIGFSKDGFHLGIGMSSVMLPAIF